MLDDGKGKDATANDGIYTAVIPASDLCARRHGVLVREGGGHRRQRLPRPALCDAERLTRSTTAPLSRTPRSAARCRWSTGSCRMSGPRRRSSGTRGSLYYDGEFYDNIAIHIRGGSTAGAPSRSTSRSTSTTATSSATATTRPRQRDQPQQHVQRQGVPAAEHGVRGLRLVRLPGQRVLPRPRGTQRRLLRRPDPHRGAGGGTPGTRRHGPARGPLQNVQHLQRGRLGREEEPHSGRAGRTSTTSAAASTTPPAPTRHNNIFDRVNLPLTLDYMVGVVLVHQNDHPHKNHYLYRDSDGSGEWCFMPWDHDLTWGSQLDRRPGRLVRRRDLRQRRPGARAGHERQALASVHRQGGLPGVEQLLEPAHRRVAERRDRASRCTCGGCGR